MVIFQKPNMPLKLALIGWVVGRLTGGALQSAGNTLYTAAIIIWAYLELSSGVNRFRKLLGGVVLAFTIYSLFLLFDAR